ncbi:hypothetical protein MIB92_01730 [Aestuariirhabdus sp. Z084]|uniref:hypothetical protein n=1 Tax=Aestuariirhabdus haliotis TaxID=2918751 RepID=UPI00201B3738|nr:hypothetical protein [Aestuariirhabdus haliotis]MCL6414359.1 hypothetical protein [Aestuariirhabdus haliotis]MCL6418291.1 hypothetical protein [Aestuariirhabdus haliotis]
MALPQRHLLVRCVYGLVMISMLVFLVWQSWLPLSNHNNPAAQELNQHVIKNLLTKVPPDSVEGDIPPHATQELITESQITGLSQRIDLNGDSAQQIRTHWQNLANSPLAPMMTQRKVIYAVYRDYEPGNHSIVLTLGFNEPIKGMDPVIIKAGKYKKLPDQTVLDAWQNTESPSSTLVYESDFERWVLNENFQPVAVTAYLGIQ